MLTIYISRAGRPPHALAAAGPLLGRARQAEAEEGQQEAAPRGRGLAIMPREIVFCLFSFCPTDYCYRYFSNVAKTGWRPEWKINVLINMQSITLNCSVFFIRKYIEMSVIWYLLTVKWILGVGKFPQFAELVVVDGHLPVVTLVVETVYEHARQRQVGGQVELLPDNLVKIFVNYAKIFDRKI